MIKFELNDIEEKEAQEFIKEHDCPIPMDSGYIRYFSYAFTPTGIGNTIKIKCSCGTEKDITDVSCW